MPKHTISHLRLLFRCIDALRNIFSSMLWEIYSRKTNQQKYSRTCAIGHLNFFDIPWHPTKMYGPKVFLLIKIRPEYSDILYNQTHFPGLLVCQIRQVLTSCTIGHISLVSWCVRLDGFHCIYFPHNQTLWYIKEFCILYKLSSKCDVIMSFHSW